MTVGSLHSALASDLGSMDATPTIDAAQASSPTAVPTMEATTVPTAAEPTPTDVPSGDMVPVHVAVWLCQTAKCPNPTTIVAGASVGLVDTTSGEQIAGCVTSGDPAGCDVEVPANASWAFVWDASTIPPGYDFDSVATVSGGGWPGEAYILQFVPTPAEPRLETVHVGVMLCDSADCVGNGTLLAGVGVASVDTNTNTQVDNCETAGDPAACAIDVPAFAPWIFTWDSTVIPDGYHYIGELSVVTGGAYPVMFLIRLVPDSVATPTATPTEVTTPAPTVAAAPTKVPVSSLPKTGAGDVGQGTGDIAGLLLVASVAALAGYAVVNRRRHA
ncbi:MAG: hypothetical protein WBA46_07260 [Thermomicrobiales bacterium]